MPGQGFSQGVAVLSNPMVIDTSMGATDPRSSHLLFWFSDTVRLEVDGYRPPCAYKGGRLFLVLVQLEASRPVFCDPNPPGGFIGNRHRHQKPP